MTPLLLFRFGYILVWAQPHDLHLGVEKVSSSISDPFREYVYNVIDLNARNTVWHLLTEWGQIRTIVSLKQYVL